MSEELHSAAARRQRLINEAIHSSRMEGLELEPESLEDLQDFVHGRLTLAEVRQRAKERHGVH